MEFGSFSNQVSVNVPTWSALQALVTERLVQKQGFALATLNLDHLVKMRASPAFRRAYQAHDMVTADGNPIVWMSRLAKRPVDLIPGSDAILPLCRVAARLGATVALVGSTEHSLKAAKSYLEREVRDLEVVLTVSPPMGFDPEGTEAEKLFEQINASGAGLCFVALGAPKQELFAAAGRRLAPTVGFASIGAGLDFFAGTQHRAPEWVRHHALEWLWRAVNSPRRLGPRYAKCMAILPGQMASAVMQRFRAPQH